MMARTQANLPAGLPVADIAVPLVDFVFRPSTAVTAAIGGFGEPPRAISTQVESLSSHPAWWLHRRAGRSAWWRHGQVRPDGGRPPGANPLGSLEFSPSPARRRLPVDPLRTARRRLVSRKIRAAERLYLSGTCSRLTNRDGVRPVRPADRMSRPGCNPGQRPTRP